MIITDGLKKLMLAAIGAGAVTYEKSSEVLEQLVKKGELTVDQGKVANTELKHNIKESVSRQKEIVREAAEKAKKDAEARHAVSDSSAHESFDEAAEAAVDEAAKAAKDIIDIFSKLSAEQIAVVKKTIDSMEHSAEDASETSDADSDCVSDIAVETPEEAVENTSDESSALTEDSETAETV